MWDGDGRGHLRPPGSDRLFGQQGFIISRALPALSQSLSFWDGGQPQPPIQPSLTPGKSLEGEDRGSVDLSLRPRGWARVRQAAPSPRSCARRRLEITRNSGVHCHLCAPWGWAGGVEPRGDSHLGPGLPRFSRNRSGGGAECRMLPRPESLLWTWGPTKLCWGGVMTQPPGTVTTEPCCFLRHL